MALHVLASNVLLALFKKKKPPEPPPPEPFFKDENVMMLAIACCWLLPAVLYNVETIAKAAESVLLAQYGVCCAWVSLVAQTGTVVFAWMPEDFHGFDTESAAAFGRAFTKLSLCMYLVLIIVYLVTQPNVFKWGVGRWGVVTYTLAYVTFLADTTHLFEGDGGHVGAILFVVGSALFMLCSNGPVYYGSVLFLVGSVSYTTDAMGWSEGLAPYGLLLTFWPGRVLFLLGAATPESDLLLRSPKKNKPPEPPPPKPPKTDIFGEALKKGEALLQEGATLAKEALQKASPKKGSSQKLLKQL